MVYGKILFNNIKEYTPSWIKTVPYSQTTKPTFGMIFFIQIYLFWKTNEILIYLSAQDPSDFQVRSRPQSKACLQVASKQRAEEPTPVASFHFLE